MGDIVCDDAAFDELYRGRGWNWDDASAWEYAPISALSLNENCVEITISPGQSTGDSVHWVLNPGTSYVTVNNEAVTVDSTDTLKIKQFRLFREWVTPGNVIHIRGGVPQGESARTFKTDIVDAALYTGTRLKEVLQSHKIELSGGIRTERADSTADTLLVIPSLSLTDLIADINKNSNNFASEMLLKTLGAQLKEFPGTADKGLSAINGVLAEIGIDTSQMNLADGSGVSRYNLVTVQVITRFLEQMYRDEQSGEIFKSSLAIGGVDGELKKRMKSEPAFSRIFAKTGTLKGVSALSGYARTIDGENIVFSMIMQHFVAPVKKIRTLQDRIADLIVTFHRPEKNTD
jgi:PBP4 family serine-type D-alanyl-D-alanine carboxypeptidase